MNETHRASALELFTVQSRRFQLEYCLPYCINVEIGVILTVAVEIG